MLWDVTQIVRAVGEGLEAEAAELDAEQAVYGIDALDELGLHPLIQRALRAGGYGVWPEQRYPSAREPRRRRSEGRRCDIALSPDGQPLTDPDAEATLFAPPDAWPLEVAYWLEVKTVSQFTTDGPFPHYSKELLSPVAHDLRKLAADRMIFHAGLLLVLFTADEATAEHDLNAWHERAMQKGYPVAPPAARRFSLTERIGNTHACCALFPVRRL